MLLTGSLAYVVDVERRHQEQFEALMGVVDILLASCRPIMDPQVWDVVAAKQNALWQKFATTNAPGQDLAPWEEEDGTLLWDRNLTPQAVRKTIRLLAENTNWRQREVPPPLP